MIQLCDRLIPVHITKIVVLQRNAILELVCIVKKQIKWLLYCIINYLSPDFLNGFESILRY